MSASLPVRLLCTWFGSGLSPKASGTAGSLAALPFAYVIQRYLGAQALLACAVALFFFGWWASAAYLAKAEDKENTDPKEIVVDEVVGQWLLLSALPLSWQAYAVGFVLFRAFDVLKPWPISWVDRQVKTGLGVMLDDVLAGFYPIVLAVLAACIASLLGMQDAVVHCLMWLEGGYA